MRIDKKNYIRYAAGFIFCLLVRLLPFRAPNIEPILATQMPVARLYGPALAFVFGVLSIVTYDILTATLGIWTLITGITYGALGLSAVYYFKNKKGSPLDYVKFAVMGTLLYDALTGLLIGPLFFHQSFSVALAGQIPFTALHLLGNSVFAFALSPAIYNFLKSKGETAAENFVNVFNIQKI